MATTARLEAEAAGANAVTYPQALLSRASDPAVAQAMVDSIPGQDTPLVQIALIDMLVQLNARSAAGDLARLAKNMQLDEMVRQRAAWALHKMETER